MERNNKGIVLQNLTHKDKVSTLSFYIKIIVMIENVDVAIKSLETNSKGRSIIDIIE